MNPEINPERPAVGRQTLVARYVLPPEAIEALSLSRVRAAVGDDWPEPERKVVHRIVYAAGDPTVAPLVRIHPKAIPRGVPALRSGTPVVVDVRMVEAGLNRRLLATFGCPVLCRIDDPAVVERARREGLPRAVVAMRQLAPRLNDAVVVVGNAPTALLALLDLVDAGVARPALIVGVPVGFVAAREAKEELRQRDVPYVTILGTRGGSPLACAALNALLSLAAGAGKDA